MTLTGGVYEFSEWDIGDRVVVDVLAPSQIVVAGRVDMGKNSSLTPGVGVEPFEVQLTVLGVNGNTGKVGATPKAVKFGIGSTVWASLWAPNGTIWLRQNAQGLGQFMARWVTVGIGATVERSVDVAPQLPPTVELVSPVDGAVVFDIEDVEATVSGVSVVSVELRVDGVVAGTLVDPDGDGTYSGVWDTQSLSDGDVVVEVAATDTAGNVGVPGSVTVTVANGFSSVDRIIEDYARGLITVDEYATLGMQALCCAQTLDVRYQSDAATLFGEPVSPDNPIDGTQLALMFLSEWDQLSQSVRDDVSSIGTIVYDPTAGGPAPLAAAAQSQGPATYSAACLFDDPWKIRVGVPVPLALEAFQCRVESQNFEVFYNEIEQSGPATSEAIHGATVNGELVDVDPANGIPDYVDVIVTEMETARSVYSAAGFSLPGKRQVAIHELLGPSWVDGFVLPWLVQYERGLNYRWDVDGDGVNDDTFLPPQYLPRHEVFHISQWEYVGVAEALVPASRIRWMMEATAEWAAHKVNEQYPVNDESGTLYARILPKQLRAPERLTEAGTVFLPWWIPERSCGAFIFFEYLEEYFASAGQPDSDIVRRIWDISGDGFPSKAATVAIDETIQAAGGTLAEVLDGFGLANYRIDRAYTDVDRSDWVTRLVNDGLAGRPGLNEKYELGAEAVDMSGTVKLGDGGTAYIEFESVPGVSGTLTFTANLPGNVSARVLEIDNHPDLCAGAVPNGRSVGATPTAVQLSDTCRTATLVLTYGSLPFADTFVSWQASFEPESVSTTRLVVQGSLYLWEYDGSTWTQLPDLPGVDYVLNDFEIFNGEVFVLVRTLEPSAKRVLRLSESGSWVVAGETGWPTNSPQQLTATAEGLYLLNEIGGGQDRFTLSRYDADLVWTQVANFDVTYAGMAGTGLGGDPQVVLVTDFGPFNPNATRTKIWSWSETNGLQQGVFETASGPVTIYEGRLGMGPSTLYGTDFIFASSSGEFLSTTDGLSWEFMAQPSGGASAMATHDGLVYLSDYSWQEVGVQEGAIQTWDGTATEVLVDPGFAMAWTSFQSDGETLWVAGFRDIDDYSQDIVEAGVYASTNGVDRVPITTGIADLEGYIPRMILWQSTP